jgi:hypothetical protein
MDAPCGHLLIKLGTVARLRLRHAAHSAPHYRARAGAVRALHAVWAMMWAIHMLRYGLCPIAAGPHRPNALCVWAGRMSFDMWMVF